ncbi:glutathione peroxidase [Roseovarius sp. TE539]|uniref:glutathione peroxidase n=1 Tax=Roseovarius sp. TE539 TaxID=2249812 RepID=UPI000DDCBAC9|nr:glutathione peroxidase [Roseovarius sp. TE539]RBI77460.1 glutathione peroxidase [Roseovarius sp. TE539]
MPGPTAPFRILAVILVLALPAMASDRPGYSFASIDGGTLSLADWEGRPVLVVNTASRCAFTKQYDGLQALYDRYRDRGLIVLAVPSGDFRQELSSDRKVKEFCELNYDLDLPMTTITPVRGEGAHVFYRWLAEAHGFVPSWNFNKVLLGPDGAVVATYGSATRPLSKTVTGEVEKLLPQG